MVAVYDCRCSSYFTYIHVIKIFWNRAPLMGKWYASNCLMEKLLDHGGEGSSLLA